MSLIIYVLFDKVSANCWYFTSTTSRKDERGAALVWLLLTSRGSFIKSGWYFQIIKSNHWTALKVIFTQHSFLTLLLTGFGISIEPLGIMCSIFFFTNASNGLFARWMFKPNPRDVRMFFHVIMQVMILYSRIKKKSILGPCIEEKYLWTGYSSIGRQFFWLLFFFQNWNNCFLIVLTVLLFQWVQAAAALIASNLAETMCAIGYERNTRPRRARRLNHVFFFHFIVSHIPLIKRCKGQL